MPAMTGGRPAPDRPSRRRARSLLGNDGHAHRLRRAGSARSSARARSPCQAGADPICSTQIRHDETASVTTYPRALLYPVACANREARGEQDSVKPPHCSPTESCEDVAMLGDERLDRQRGAAPDRLNEIIGSRKDAVRVIDGDLAEVLHQELAAWPAGDPIGL